MQPMRRMRSQRDSTAGFTLLELMLAAGVMAVGLIMLMQSFVAMNLNSRVAEDRIIATNFNNSVLEALRGQERNTILTFNKNNELFSIDGNGYVNVPRLGRAKLNMSVMVPMDGGMKKYPLPVDLSGNNLPTFPNPLEVQVELVVDKGHGAGLEYRFSTSSAVFYE